MSNTNLPELKLDNNKHTLIIKAGLTGSGKSEIPKWLCENYKIIGDKESYTDIVIDDIVEQNDKYKSMINCILELYNITEKSSNAEIQNFIDNELVKQYCCSAYFTVRKNSMYNCNKNEMEIMTNACEYEGKSVTCDFYNDTLISDAIKKKSDIVLETTGEWSIDWLFNTNNNPHIPTDEYNVLYVYSIVEFNELVKRNQGRTIGQIKKYLENREKNPAFRLTDTTAKTFKEKYINIINNLEKLLSSHNQVLIYDNSGERNKQKLCRNNLDNIKKIINLPKNKNEDQNVGCIIV